jgi:1-acyl-sn-glycerol-3-phosphate acyltransferase
VGPSVPRAGNALTRALARGALRVAGWRIEGTVPDEPKLVLVGAPHTTNWDFLLTKLTAGALGVRLFWVGKQSLFPGWLAPLGRRLGGIPVDRASSDGFVDTMVAEFRRRDRFYLALMPAGSRSTPDRWRSGFYYIARDAGVPLFLVGFDWDRRTMRLGPVLDAPPGTRYEDEVARIQANFEGLTGRRVGAACALA